MTAKAQAALHRYADEDVVARVAADRDAEAAQAIDEREKQPRQNAEQAALGLPRAVSTGDSFTPYSEQILPWIRQKVEAADKLRRLREDLLFASPTGPVILSERQMVTFGRT